MNFVWFSNASDETGKTLATALGYTGGKTTPDFSEIKNLVCWGAKGGTKYNPENLNSQVASGNLRVLNHPDRVAQNRDKLWMLERMRDRNVPVPGFVPLGGDATAKLATITDALEKGHVNFPLLLMSKTNRGQPSFVYTMCELEACLCSGKQQVSDSELKIELARSYTHGVDYRLHVFRDAVIWAEVKLMSEDPVGSLTATLRKRLAKKAKASDVVMNASDSEIEFIVRELAEDLLLGPHQYQQTVGRGCELIDTPAAELPAEAVVAAIQAIDAVELDMGAVNLSWDDGDVRVTNVISYPRLSEEQQKAYVEAITSFVGDEGNSEKKIPKLSTDAPAPELIARLRRKISKLSNAKAKALLEDLE